MLNKDVIYLRKIILVKAFIYTSCISIMLILLITLKKEVNVLIAKQKESLKPSRISTLRKEDVVDFRNKIWDINDQYKKLIKNIDTNTTSNHDELISNINLISKKNHLVNPIKINISKEISKKIKSNKRIQTHSYNAKIKLRIDNYDLLFNILKEIHDILPKGSVIKSTKIKQSTILTPQIIKEFNSNKSHNLIKVQVEIQLRKIAYE